MQSETALLQGLKLQRLQWLSMLSSCTGKPALGSTGHGLSCCPRAGRRPNALYTDRTAVCRWTGDCMYNTCVPVKSGLSNTQLSRPAEAYSKVDQHGHAPRLLLSKTAAASGAYAYTSAS